MDTDTDKTMQAGITAFKISCSSIILIFFMLFCILLWKIWESRNPWQKEQYVAVSLPLDDLHPAVQAGIDEHPDFVVNRVLFNVALHGTQYQQREGGCYSVGSPFGIMIYAYQATNENAMVKVISVNANTAGKTQQSYLQDKQPIIMDFKIHEGREYNSGYRTESYKRGFCFSRMKIDAQPTKNEKVSVFITVEVANPPQQEKPVRETLHYDFKPQVTRGLWPSRWLAK